MKNLKGKYLCYVKLNMKNITKIKIVKGLLLKVVRL